MNKKTITWVIVAAVIGLLALPKLLPKKDEGKAQAGGRPAGPPPPVKVGIYVAHREGVVNTIQAVGNVMAEDEIELRSEAQGRVMKINFNEGQEVKKGQLLVKINDGDLQAQLKKAISARRLREETERRNHQLLDKGGISREEYDISQTELSTANADIELLREQIRRTEVTAPFDGLVGLKSISEGGFINSNNIIARLQSIRRVKIEFSVPEKYAAVVKSGRDISFTVEGHGETFHAKIYAIEPKIDPVNRNIVVRAISENADRRLLPGAFAKISVALEGNPDALMIPTQAVVPVLKGQKVFVVKGDSAVEKRVEIGLRNDVNVEIRSGLEEGDSVVVNGVIQMKPGTRVKISR